MTDPQDEAQRLRELYAGMSDGELMKIVASGDELTEDAENTLRQEMSRRGLQPPPEEAPPGYDLPEYSEVVTIRRYRDLLEAQLAKGKLEAAGIACELVNENIVRMSWLYSDFFGGVRLEVRPADAENALSVLDEPIPESIDVEGVGEIEQPRCPKCQSLDITYESIDKAIAYGSLFVFKIPVVLAADRWKCNACGQYWQEVPDEVTQPDDSPSE